jgi:conjugative relaxase-like TrwC/TraI family protein
MLSIARMRSGQERYYLDLAQEDYYLEGGEPPGQWFGRAAESLGFVGEVKRQALRDAFKGVGPDGQTLGQVQVYKDGRKRQPGWDLTFSAPKSVSILWALADEPLRLAIEKAHAQAVRAALTYVEQTATFSRRGKQGTDVHPVAPLMALFDHGTSRAQDPQLHTHVLFLNAGLRADGTWGTIRSRDIYLAKMATGALYRAELAFTLKQSHNLEFVLKRTWIELSIVPEHIIFFFSKRRAQILEQLSKWGLSGPKAAEQANTTTRQSRDHLPRGELRKGWRQAAQEMSFPAEEVQQKVSPATTQPRRDERAILSAVRLTVNALIAHRDVFSEHDIVRGAAERLQANGARADDITRVAHEYASNDQELVVLAGTCGNRTFTSTRAQKADQELSPRAKRLLQQAGHRVSAEKLKSAVRPHVLVLTEEHRDALQYLTQFEGGIRCLSGATGQTKARLLIAARDAWTAAGFNVVGCAKSKEAARALRGELRIPALTVGQFLYNVTPSLLRIYLHVHEQLMRAASGWEASTLRPVAVNRKTILVVDEAEGFSSRDLLKVVNTARSRRVKLVLFGDAREPSAFSKLLAELGGVTIKKSEPTPTEWERRALKQLRGGTSEAALAEYAKSGNLHTYATKDHLLFDLISAWQQRRTSEWASTLLIAAHQDDVDTLNRMAQSSRLQAGEIRRRYRVVGGKGAFYLKDRVVFTESRRSHGVRAGDTGTIEAFKHQGLLLPDLAIVRIDGTKQVGSHIVRTRVGVELGRKAPLRLAYARTPNEAGGSSVERTFILGGAWLTNPAIAHHCLSQASDSTNIYMSEDDAGKQLCQLVRARAEARARQAKQQQDQQASQEQVQELQR